MFCYKGSMLFQPFVSKRGLNCGSSSIKQNLNMLFYWRLLVIKEKD